MQSRLVLMTHRWLVLMSNCPQSGRCAVITPSPQRRATSNSESPRAMMDDRSSFCSGPLKRAAIILYLVFNRDRHTIQLDSNLLVSRTLWRKIEDNDEENWLQIFFFAPVCIRCCKLGLVIKPLKTARSTTCLDFTGVLSYYWSMPSVTYTPDYSETVHITVCMHACIEIVNSYFLPSCTPVHTPLTKHINERTWSRIVSPKTIFMATLLAED